MSSNSPQSLGRRSSSGLAATFIDVGHGDSILLETRDKQGEVHYALVDSGDTTDERMSYSFLRKYFERTNPSSLKKSRLFDFIVMTHPHRDHMGGLRRIMSEYGAQVFFTPSVDLSDTRFATLLVGACGVDYGGAKQPNYANRPVNKHRYLYKNKQFNWEQCSISVLWPPASSPGVAHHSDENNTSIVLAITLNQVTFVLTGDCQAENWDSTKVHLQNVKDSLRLFQVPHHGAYNGMFHNGNTPWLTEIRQFNTARKQKDPVSMAISCHPVPDVHPDPQVALNLDAKTTSRTDLHYHLRFETDGYDLRDLRRYWTYELA